MSVARVVDTTAPTLTAVSLVSSNANSTTAKVGDKLTLNITASEELLQSSVGVALQLISLASTYTQIPGSGRCADTAGKHKTAKRFIAGGGGLAALQNACTLDTACVALSYSSSSTKSSILYTSNGCTNVCTVTSWLTNRALIVNTVTINGNSVRACFVKSTCSGINANIAMVGSNKKTWSATYTLGAADSNCNALGAGFVVVFKDLAGNSGTAVTSTTDSTAVLVDTTPPVLPRVWIRSNNLVNARYAKTGHVITIMLYSSEMLLLSPSSVLKFNAVRRNVALASNNTYQYVANYTVQTSSAEGLSNFTISPMDLAGNVGTLVTNSTDNSSVIIDLTPPVLVGCVDTVGTTDTGRHTGSGLGGGVNLTWPSVSDNIDPAPGLLPWVGGLVVNDSTAFPYHTNTTVTFRATDQAGWLTTCDVVVDVEDDQAPLLQSCTNLSIVGSTNVGQPYATQDAGRVKLFFPSVADNSGEVLTVNATVDGEPLTGSHRFHYERSGRTNHVELNVSRVDGAVPNESFTNTSFGRALAPMTHSGGRVQVLAGAPTFRESGVTRCNAATPCGGALWTWTPSALGWRGEPQHHRRITFPQGVVQDGDEFGASIGVLGNGSAAVGAPGITGGGGVWLLSPPSAAGPTAPQLQLRPVHVTRAACPATSTSWACSGLQPSGLVRFGASLAALPDMDGDGLPELAVGDPGAAGGAVWILYLARAGGAGDALGVRQASPLNATHGNLSWPAALGSSGSPEWGSGVASLGTPCVNGSAMSLAVSARGAANSTALHVSVLFLFPNATCHAQTQLAYELGAHPAHVSLSSPGDADGDGVPDVLCAAGDAVVLLLLRVDGLAKLWRPLPPLGLAAATPLPSLSVASWREAGQVAKPMLLVSNGTALELHSVAAVSTTVVAYGTRDSTGHVSNCTITVRVQDVEAPNLTACASVTATTDFHQPYGTAAAGDVRLRYPAVVDNSGEQLTDLVVAHVNGTLYEPGSRFPIGNSQVVYHVRDSAGLSSSCSVNVTVEDDEAPRVDCHNELAVSAVTDLGHAYATISSGGVVLRWPRVVDNSGLVPATVVAIGGRNVSATHRFPYAGSEGLLVTTLTFTVTDRAGHATVCNTSVTVNECAGFTSTQGCDKAASTRTPALVVFVGVVSEEALVNGVLAALRKSVGSAAAAAFTVVVTSYMQTVRTGLTLPGSAATFAEGSTSGEAARLQFRAGVGALVGVETEYVLITGVQSAAAAAAAATVTVSYTVTAGSNVAPSLTFAAQDRRRRRLASSNASSLQQLSGAINGAGSTLSLNSSNISASNTSSTTAIGFSVVTNGSSASSTSNLTSSVSSLLNSSSKLTSSVNAAGGSATSSSTSAISAKNCTAGTTLSNSDRSLLSPCVGTVGQVCVYNCSAGLAPFGQHVCRGDGRFSGGICVPSGRLPYLCNGVLRTVPVVNAAAAMESYTPTRSTIERYREATVMQNRSSGSTECRAWGGGLEA